MATCDAAAAIGRGDELGVLAPGQLADVVLYDTSGAHWIPDDDPYEALVWRSVPSDVRTVVVGGEVVVADGRCTTLQPDLEAFAAASARLRQAVLAPRAGLGRAEDGSVSSRP
jgi:5-methylthioadenosine/S-adenosylhomocysteine deaminase